MLNNVLRVSASSLVAAILMCSAGAESAIQKNNKLKLAAGAAKGDELNLASHEGAESKGKFFDGKNFFMVKGGIAKPTHSKISNLKVFDVQKPTYTIGAMIGRDFNDLLAFDLEYRFNPNSKSLSSTNSQKSWEVRSHSFLANAKINLVKDSNVTPYLRGGVGLGINRGAKAVGTKTPSNYTYWPGKTTNSFVWQAGLGFNFKYNNLISTTLEYMYANLGTFKTQGTQITTIRSGITTTSVEPVKGKLKEHIVTFGIKFNF